MNPRPRSRRWTLVILAALLIGAAVFVLPRAFPYLVPGRHETPPPLAAAETVPDRPQVAVVHPQVEVTERTVLQPGSIQAFESVDLFAGVPGYLKTLAVDIGDRVKQGQVLARVDVPDLEKQVQRHAAAVDQAGARVGQTQARVASAKADFEAAQTAITQAQAAAKSAAATLRFREQQLQRMRDLFASRSIEERLVDEKFQQRDAALEAERAAQAAVESARANLAAVQGKIQLAEADVLEARAEVKVAQAELERSQVLVGFACLRAPFNGVVTHRNIFPGDYVRPPSPGASAVPLLTVQRTDLMRVVVQVPDRDVPFTDVGDPAEVEVDALPGERLPAKVSRLAASEDPATRLMRVEIDLPNPTGKLAHGMFGHVVIFLDRVKSLTVPSTALVGSIQDGKGSIYVVRNGHASLISVPMASCSGSRLALLGGVGASDEVIARPPADLVNGAEVVPVASASEASQGGPGHPSHAQH